jgi:hypothetical protein
MVEIDVTCHLEAFRRFLVNSTCRSFVPESYLRDPEVFPEKETEPGSIYIEAADKVTLKRIRDITFVNANEVLGIIYTSKSGHSRLKWRQQSGPMGRVTGDASSNSLVNLSMAGVLTREYVEELVNREEGVDAEPHEDAPPPVSPAAPGTGSSPAAPRPPIAGEPTFPPDEEEDDFEAADADEEEQEDLEEQREETA